MRLSSYWLLLSHDLNIMPLVTAASIHEISYLASSGVFHVIKYNIKAKANVIFGSWRSLMTFFLSFACCLLQSLKCYC